MMFKLVVLCVYEPIAKLPDKAFEAVNAFSTSEQAEKRALRWLAYRPNDIVMLVES